MCWSSSEWPCPPAKPLCCRHSVGSSRDPQANTHGCSWRHKPNQPQTVQVTQHRCKHNRHLCREKGPCAEDDEGSLGPAGAATSQRPFLCSAINQEFKQLVKRLAQNNGRAGGKPSWAGFTPSWPLREPLLSQTSNTWASQAENPVGNVGGPAAMAGGFLNSWETPKS